MTKDILKTSEDMSHRTTSVSWFCSSCTNTACKRRNFTSSFGCQSNTAKPRQNPRAKTFLLPSRQTLERCSAPANPFPGVASPCPWRRRSIHRRPAYDRAPQRELPKRDTARQTAEHGRVDWLSMAGMRKFLYKDN